jgi:hypothetical protein
MYSVYKMRSERGGRLDIGGPLITQITLIMAWHDKGDWAAEGRLSIRQGGAVSREGWSGLSSEGWAGNK